MLNNFFNPILDFVSNHLTDFSGNESIVSVKSNDVFIGEYISEGFVFKNGNPKEIYYFVALITQNGLVKIWKSDYMEQCFKSNGAKYGDILIIKGLKNPNNPAWTSLDVKVIYKEHVQYKMNQSIISQSNLVPLNNKTNDDLTEDLDKEAA